MVDPSANSEPVIERLRILTRQLVQPWHELGHKIDAICPDGILWRVPWQCLEYEGCPPNLILHPSSNSSTENSFQANGKKLLWMSGNADLKHAQKEARAFLTRFPNAKVCRDFKSAKASLDGEYDLVHVVAHSRHREENPMFSSIEFKDGSIFAADIARSALRARIVTLAACDTGALSLISKEEPDGLARAFLSRGANYVIGSAFALHDEASAMAFRAFYDCLNEGESVRHTLHVARMRTRAWQEHPYYWGALAVYRGYGI